MARTPAGFPGGVRISDYLTVNVIAQVYPHDTVRDVLRQTDSDSLRRRDLPAEVLLVRDGAYAEYVDDGAYEDGTALSDEAGNVLVTRTFSKIFALAGLRLGWAYGPPELLDPLRRIGPTFPISAAAVAAGREALADRAHAEAVLAHNRAWRAAFELGAEAPYPVQYERSRPAMSRSWIE